MIINLCFLSKIDMRFLTICHRGVKFIKSSFISKFNLFNNLFALTWEFDKEKHWQHETSLAYQMQKKLNTSSQKLK